MRPVSTGACVNVVVLVAATTRAASSARFQIIIGGPQGRPSRTACAVARNSHEETGAIASESDTGAVCSPRRVSPVADCFAAPSSGECGATARILAYRS